MPRKASGQVIERAGRWFVRCTHKGQRRIFLLESRTLAAARKEGTAFAQIVAREGFPDEGDEARVPAGEVVSKWWERYLRYRELRGQRAVAAAQSRFHRWIRPVIGGMRIALVTRADVEAIVRRLDRAIREGEISPKTAKNVFGEVRSAFSEARDSKQPNLRVRPDSPAEHVRGPDDGPSPERQILFPEEVVALLECDSIPRERRYAYAFAIYLGARSSELEALEARSIDLQHERVCVDGQIDRDTGGRRATKTRRVRSFDLEPALLPLARQLTEARPTGYLLRMAPIDQRAKLLRLDLLAAGVRRPELHENRPGREWLTFHDLRHTCLTWMAARGDDALKIQWRAGHTAFEMTQRYIAAARNLPPKFGTPFPAIPSSLVQKAPEKAPTLRRQLQSAGNLRIIDGGNAWESNPPVAPWRAYPPVLKTGAGTSPARASMTRDASALRFADTRDRPQRSLLGAPRVARAS
jgi:integrase